jgi:hypothetical protein
MLGQCSFNLSQLDTKTSNLDLIVAAPEKVDFTAGKVPSHVTCFV